MSNSSCDIDFVSCHHNLLYFDMNKLHFEIIIMFVDIICLAYREQKYIYVKVFDGQDIYFKKLLPPPLNQLFVP